MRLTVYNGSEELHMEAQSDNTLLAALVGGGVFVDAPCGGGGKCGKCRVLVAGPVTPLTQEELSLLSPEDRASGVRLACCVRPLGDVTVMMAPQQTVHVQTTASGGQQALCPTVRRVALRVPAATLEAQRDDCARVTAALAGAGVPTACWTLTARQHAPAALRLRDGRADAVLYGSRLLDVAAETPLTGLAVDIGTTTVVAYFYDLESGVQLCVQSGLNPQRAFGADVITRIAACAEPDGLDRLQQAVVGLLSRLISLFCADTGRPAASIYHVTVAANTTMLHLLAGIDPTNIAGAPFISATLFGFDLPAREIGLPVCPDAPVSLLPSISSYVGADITAGLVQCGLDRCDDRVVYIDIGTNGEMAYCGGRDTPLLCCSTAAGPAFEGAHIRCGTGGVPGAISSVRLDNETVVFDTIGGLPPVGICGSGLIDAIAALLHIGAIDETGRLADEDELDAPFCDCLNDEGDFVFDSARGILLTQKDVREVQLAKAAICAGILTMLHTAGVSVGQVDRVVIAGGFGAHIDPDSACAIGLLPKEAAGKVEIVGNAAGFGAVSALLNAESLARMRALTAECRYIELSGDPFFQDAYVEQMMFE